MNIEDCNTISNNHVKVILKARESQDNILSGNYRKFPIIKLMLGFAKRKYDELSLNILIWH